MSSKRKRTHSEEAREEVNVHQEYVKLHQLLEEKADEIVRPDGSTDFLHDAVEKSTTLLNRSSTTQHMMDDSKFVFTASGIVKQRTANAKVDTTKDFDLKSYVTSLGRLLKRNEGTTISSVSDIGSLAYKYLNRVPTIGFMFGPLDINKRPTKRRAAMKLNVGAASAPTDVKETYHGEEDAEQAKLIESVYLALVAQGGEVHLLEFILNPSSFSETVENLFYVSFLVKDGLVKLDMDDDGIPTITALPKPKDIKGKQKQHPRTQLVIDLDMEAWKELCSIYDEAGEGGIPARNNTDTGRC